MYSQSIAEYSLIHIPTRKIINFCDSAELFFNYIGEKKDLFNIELTNSGENCRSGLEYYEGEYWNITVVRKDYEMNDGLKFWMETSGSEHPKTDFRILDLEVNKDFKTIRGIGIGDSAFSIIKQYPNINGYKKHLVDFDRDELKKNLIKKDLTTLNKLPSSLKCLAINDLFFTTERADVAKPPYYYFLVFDLDSDMNVLSIKIVMIPDGK